MPNRIRGDLHDAAVRVQDPVLARRAEPAPLDVIDERLLVAFGLQADDVVRAHELHQLFMRRHGPQHLGRREGNVQEEADRVLHAELAQAVRERQQVIVVHPDDVVGLHERAQLLRERAVHAQIAGIFLAIEAREIAAIVKYRPQRGIREAAIVLVVVAAGQADGRIGHVAVPLDHGLLGRAGDLAVPAEPDAARLLQRVEHADRQPARRRTRILAGRHAIRYHDQSAHYGLPSCIRLPGEREKRHSRRIRQVACHLATFRTLKMKTDVTRTSSCVLFRTEIALIVEPFRACAALIVIAVRRRIGRGAGRRGR